jgi:hypothetical protein
LFPEPRGLPRRLEEAHGRLAEEGGGRRFRFHDRLERLLADLCVDRREQVHDGPRHALVLEKAAVRGGALIQKALAPSTERIEFSLRHPAQVAV